MASGGLPHGAPVGRGGAQIGPVRLERAPPHLTRGPGRCYGTEGLYVMLAGRDNGLRAMMDVE